MATTTRRRPAAKKTVVAPAKTEAPTTRKTEGYTVDLTAEGVASDKNWDKLLTKDPSGNILEFVEWFQDQTGYKLDTKTAQFTVASYAHFQRSPEHREVTKKRREAAANARKARDAAKVERAKKAALAAGLQIVE